MGPRPKIALIHYWWLSTRGGEAVVKAILEIYPDADLYVHVCDVDAVKQELGSIHTGEIFQTFISKLPFAKKQYQKYLPLMPYALEALDLSTYDIVISNESGPTKGVITRPDTLHVCYCLSPMRYIWDLQHEYTSKMNWIVKFIFEASAHKLRMWDYLSAQRPDKFLAISNFVKSRINKFYRLDADIIYPPVNVDQFRSDMPRSPFYLYLGQLVPYKRADIAMKAFEILGLPLVIIGEGEMFDELQQMAPGNVTLLGRQNFDVVKEHLESCRGLIFPGVEDFGIVPLEAMAAGAPVIAFRGGGALDTVVDEETGVFFDEQTPKAIVNAVNRLETGELSFDSEKLHEYAKRFDVKVFQAKFKQFLELEYKAKRG